MHGTIVIKLTEGIANMLCVEIDESGTTGLALNALKLELREALERETRCGIQVERRGF